MAISNSSRQERWQGYDASIAEKIIRVTRELCAIRFLSHLLLSGAPFSSSRPSSNFSGRTHVMVDAL